MSHRVSLQTLGLIIGVFTMAACGGDGAEVLSSSSTAAVASTSATGGANGESTIDVADGDESMSTEPGGAGESTSTEPTVATTATTATVPGRNTTPGPSTTPDTSTTTSQPLPASSGPVPWSAAPLELSDLPDAYRLEWAEAGEPSACPFLAFADLGPEAEQATIRRAEHAREMLVVWDNPDGPGHDRRGEPCPDCGRGVVGLGTWQGAGNAVGPATIAWDDGSFANITTTIPWVLYGVTARIQPAGADCMYQIWSHIGVEHVEYLISQLRRVSA
jgi:hypothetical protein